jgi:X-Pro dipeptidyl-peptidase
MGHPIRMLLPVLIIFFLFSASGHEPQAIPVFKDGEAQIVKAFEEPDKWIRHDLWVETTFDTDGDGRPDRMHVSVTRPYQTGYQGLKLPVIYISSPYFAGVAPDVEGFFWDVQHELGFPPESRIHPEVLRKGNRPFISDSHIKTWVPRGYVVVHSSSPGTGLSQGAPTVGGANESLAPKAVINWLCGRAPGFTSPDGDERVYAYWSTGKVGMTGTSYNGTIALAAATTGVEGLEAIIPIAPNTSYYHYYRSNGLIRFPGGYLGEDIDVLYDYIHSGDKSKRAYNNTTIRDTKMRHGMDRVTGDYNDFWAQRDYLNHMKPMKAALLMAHGFNDWNVMPEHSYRIFREATEMGLPVQLYYHQDGHGGHPPLGMMNRWFTHYLHGIENGVEEDPKVWIVRESDRQDNPTPYEAYPNPKASPVTFYLHPGAPGRGQLNTSKPDNSFTEMLVDNYSFDGNSLAKAEFTNHRLMYLTPELIEDIHISGIPEINIRLTSSKPAANLSVWLVSLPWNESTYARTTDNIITRGWANPQNYKSLTESEPLIPGRYYTMQFELQPDDQVIQKGQQIGLMIFSSDKEFTVWPEPGTELTIDLDATRITIPIVGGIESYHNSIKD